MAQEYTIKQVSQQPPRKWEGPHGDIFYIKVALDGHKKPVEIGKKSAGALKAGDKVFGTIKETEFPNDGFKSEKQQLPFGAKRDDSAIQAQWAIGQAIKLYTSKNNADKLTDFNFIENNATKLFSMIDRVKSAQPPIKDEQSEFVDQINSTFGEVN